VHATIYVFMEFELEKKLCHENIQMIAGRKQVFICATIRNSCFLLFIFLLGQKYLFELKLYKHTYYVDMVACPTRKIFFSLECVPTCTGTREYSGSF